MKPTPARSLTVWFWIFLGLTVLLLVSAYLQPGAWDDPSPEVAYQMTVQAHDHRQH